MKQSIATILCIFICFVFSCAEKINVEELKCMVCKRTVEEMEREIENVDPKKTVEVGAYRLDHKGNQGQKKIEYRRSEVFLTEMMDHVCTKMDDYVRATSKKTGRLTVMPLIINGAMNPKMGEYTIIQDGDLNKSLKFHCETMIEEFEEGITKYLAQGGNDLDIRICTDLTKYCNQKLDEAYEFEGNDEL